MAPVTDRELLKLLIYDRFPLPVHNAYSDEPLIRFELVDPNQPVVRAFLEPAASEAGIQLSRERGDDLCDLSTILGNDDGEFVPGTNFHVGAIDLTLDDGDTFSASLPQRSGDLKTTGIRLHEWLDLTEYVWANETCYKIGYKPLTRPGRTLVLCFDGTSNQFSNQNTNVVKFVELLAKKDPGRQMVYYQTGVGTYTSPAWTNFITQTVAKYTDMAFGSYLYQHVIDGYKFLMQTYRAGDRICLFGFSRGAFTARALAGMIHCVGLLPRHNMEHVPFAYKIYASHWPSTDTSPPTQPGAPGALRGNTRAQDVDPTSFKQAFSIPVMIDFVGVWDTVASVGFMIPKTLPYIAYNPSILVFRHALALDERRANFVPSQWDHDRTKRYQSVREVWFRGQHTDIGGGAPKDPSDQERYTELSNITLRWMVNQCLHRKNFIVFDREALRLYRQVNVLEAHDPAETEGLLDKTDVKKQPYETMGWFSPWNLCEFWPAPRPTHSNKGTVVTTYFPNLYRPRTIWLPSGQLVPKRPEVLQSGASSEPSNGVYIHVSVVDFLGTAERRGYVPRSIWHASEKKKYPLVDWYDYSRFSSIILDSEDEVKSAIKLGSPPGLVMWLMQAVGDLIRLFRSWIKHPIGFN